MLKNKNRPGESCYKDCGEYKYVGALTAYENVIRLDPKSVSAYYNKATLLRELGMMREALAVYDVALRLI